MHDRLFQVCRVCDARCSRVHTSRIRKVAVGGHNIDRLPDRELIETYKLETSGEMRFPTNVWMTLEISVSSFGNGGIQTVRTVRCVSR